MVDVETNCAAQIDTIFSKAVGSWYHSYKQTLQLNYDGVVEFPNVFWWTDPNKLLRMANRITCEHCKAKVSAGNHS